MKKVLTIVSLSITLTPHNTGYYQEAVALSRHDLTLLTGMLNHKKQTDKQIHHICSNALLNVVCFIEA